MTRAVPVFLALAAIALVGGLLYRMLPGVDVDRLRRDLNRLVLTVLLPALNFHVIYTAKLGDQMWIVPSAAAAALLAIVAVGLAVFGFVRDGRVRGALILCCACSNVTYMGLPVVRGLFPGATQQVTETVILYEMTITPLNLLLAGWLGSRSDREPQESIGSLLRQVAVMPLLWAIALGLVLNVGGVPVPTFVLQATNLLGETLSGLMMLSLGMALKPEMLRRLTSLLALAAPTVVLKLAVSPLLVLGMVHLLDAPPPYGTTAVILAAMPTQLIVLVTADRFGLSVEQAAPIIFLDTALSFLTVPLLFAWLA